MRDQVFLDGKVHDPQRIDFMHRYLAELARAIKDGVPVTGYYAWSLLDNFEWADGYKQRFGLVYVDYQNQKRVPKDSFDWYKKVIAIERQDPRRQDRRAGHQGHAVARRGEAAQRRRRRLRGGRLVLGRRRPRRGRQPVDHRVGLRRRLQLRAVGEEPVDRLLALAAGQPRAEDADAQRRVGRRRLQRRPRRRPPAPRARSSGSVFGSRYGFSDEK